MIIMLAITRIKIEIKIEMLVTTIDKYQKCVSKSKEKHRIKSDD